MHKTRPNLFNIKINKIYAKKLKRIKNSSIYIKKNNLINNYNLIQTDI
jgi:hypothetical protein